MQNEYLIKRTDGLWFSIGPKNFTQALIPKSWSWKQIDGWGDFRIHTRDSEISFAYEDAGLLTCFECSNLNRAQQFEVLSEILSSIETVTGEKGEVVAL